MSTRATLVAVAIVVLASQAWTTNWYFAKSSGPVPDPLDSAFVNWEAYQVEANDYPSAPAGFDSVGYSWFATHNGKSPSEAYDAALVQGQTDDHSGTDWYWGSFVNTMQPGGKYVYPGSYTWRSMTGAIGPCAVACTTYEAQTKQKIKRPWYSATAWKVYYCAQVIYPGDHSYRWDQYGWHHKGGATQTSHYWISY